MEGSKVIQHLLRPTDTCVIVVQGHLLGVYPPAPRFIAIIRHEGTEENALFLFELDSHSSPVTVKVEVFYPIKGSFSSEVKVTKSSQCHILLNNGMGSSLALQLPNDSHTAVFVSQMNKALHQFSQSQTANSSSSFSWLLGYEHCRTGWDRFSKPHSGPLDSLINLNSDPYKYVFPDTWPWSHIITPNSDGTTEIARCELLESFDPLMQKKTSPTTSISYSADITVTKPSPTSSPSYHKNNSPFHAADNINPFLSSSSPPKRAENSLNSTVDKRLKHCISDTNLNKLKLEHTPFQSLDHMEHLFTRSEEDLTATTDEISPRHCVAKTTTTGSRNRSPKANKKKRSEEKQQNDNHLSRSLFFVKLDENEETSFGTNHLSNHLSYSRQTSSTNSSPVQERKNPTKHGPKYKLEFLNPSGIKPVASKVNSRSPELSKKYNHKGRTRDRSKSALPSSLIGEKSSQWVHRYRPGVPVPILGETARESIMQSELRHREEEFCSPVHIRIFCATWNVNGRSPPLTMDPLLREYDVKGDKGSSQPDIYAIGFQELDLSAQCLLQNETNREDIWVDAVEQSLHRVGSYTRLCCVRLVGIMLLVYIENSLCPYVTNVEMDQVATGMHGYLGNKGGVGVHFNLHHSSLCFVNSHFAAHTEEVEKRNQEFALIMSKTMFSTPEIAYDIIHHDMIFWLGDLNYRIPTTAEMTCDMIKAMADAYQLPKLLKVEQLYNEMEKNNVFVGFREADIDFKPTYKYDPNTDNWDSSEKHRAPAWCDRILHRGKDIVQLSYTSHATLKISDHKPVSALFNSKLRKVDPQKERLVLEQITWRLDKLENDTLPQVDLNVTEFCFTDVRFKVPQVRRLVVTNTGQAPVHISFIPKLDDKSLTKDWLVVKPVSAVLHPLEDVLIEFKVHVDEDSAPALTLGRVPLEDILVLHLEKGKDFFISVTGNYLPSCFGSSLDTLVNLHTYIREVPVAELVDLTSSWEEYPKTVDFQTPPALDIPKELFAIVDFIERNGIDKEGLFSDGGRASELEEIIDMLDTGGKDLPGSVFSVASILLTFLAALAEPVVPVSLHSRCMDCCNNATLCKQILCQMPTVHRRTFEFLISFMKNLLKHADVNGLDPKVLATIFGEVLLKTPLNERKSRSRKQLNTMNRKKATFVYQFIANDLTPVGR